MIEKLNPDYWAPRLLFKLSPWINVEDDLAKVQFSSHAFSMAFLTFMTLTLPWSWAKYLALWPFCLAMLQEFYWCGHWRDFLKNTPEGKDGRTDVISRGLGALAPFLTLLWR